MGILTGIYNLLLHHRRQKGRDKGHKAGKVQDMNKTTTATTKKTVKGLKTPPAFTVSDLQKKFYAAQFESDNVSSEFESSLTSLQTVASDMINSFTGTSDTMLECNMLTDSIYNHLIILADYIDKAAKELEQLQNLHTDLYNQTASDTTEKE